MKHFSLICGICFAALQSQAIISNGAHTAQELDTTKMTKVPVTVIADYREQGFTGVLDLGTYTHIDDHKIIKQMNQRYDGHTHKIDGTCSSLIKEIQTNGEKSLIMGRNMDLPNSPYPAYIFRINMPDRYRSVNIGYITSGLQTFDQILKDNGIIHGMYDTMPYLITDTMNEKGLIIETNMRNSTPNVIMTGTNPGAKIRIASFNVARYLSDHAADIEEALKLVDTLDVYSPKSPATSWHFALAMMDASGRYGVLEFVDNKPVWHEKQPGQTNFWIDKGAYQKTNSNVGLGRWDNITKASPKVENQQDMRRLMQNVWYSQLFSVPANQSKFDVRSEQVGLMMRDMLPELKKWIKEYNLNIDTKRIQQMEEWSKAQKEEWTTTYCLDNKNRKVVEGFTDFMTDIIVKLPAKSKQTSGLQELSAISYTIDNKEQIYHVQFFEQPEIFDVSLDGIKK